MKYIIYVAVAVLVLWSVWYVLRHVYRQFKGRCSCDGNCASCGNTCKKGK